MRGKLINLLWIFIEKGGLISLSFITFYFFALYLSPEEYGEAIFALALVELVGMFLCSMWNDPLVRTQFKLNVAYSSVFWLGGFVALVSMCILLLLIFAIDEAGMLFFLVLVASLKVLASVWARPFVSKLRRDKNFKLLALRTLIGKVLGAFVGIIMVIKGFGPLAVIMQLVIMEFFSLVTLMRGNIHQITSKPNLAVFLSISKEGVPVAIRQILTNSLVRGIVIVLGVSTSKTAVGYFAFANRIVELPYSAFVMGLRSYAIPVFSNRSNDLKGLSSFVIKLTVATSFIIIPIFIGSSLLAPPFISWLFNTKWDDAIYLFQIIVLLVGVRVFVMYHSMCMIALGKASVGVIFEIVSVIVTLLAVYFLADYFGVLGAVCALSLNVILDFVIKVWSLSRVMDSQVRKHLKACLAITFSGALMYTALLVSSGLISNLILSSIFSFFLALLVYILTLVFFKMDLKNSVLNALKN